MYMYLLDVSMSYVLYILLDFEVTEGLRRGPEFSHNYTIGYLIITS